MTKPLAAQEIHSKPETTSLMGAITCAFVLSVISISLLNKREIQLLVRCESRKTYEVCKYMFQKHGEKRMQNHS